MSVKEEFEKESNVKSMIQEMCVSSAGLDSASQIENIIVLKESVWKGTITNLDKQCHKLKNYHLSLEAELTQRL